ncbi:hypothetical protein FF38_12407 [Lucilia cuprina]|uniref:Uncharacterized protein n=1 Tax=Lucilia cuprina TaxID=7375 RepID=A0A0L0CHU1_LUCCU|nr:hypothetical protein FF38_12407 [Lucilia cuprina]
MTVWIIQMNNDAISLLSFSSPYEQFHNKTQGNDFVNNIHINSLCFSFAPYNILVFFLVIMVNFLTKESNALYISSNFYCVGYHDCADESDEANCTAIACPDNKFFCPSGDAKCILKTRNAY